MQDKIIPFDSYYVLPDEPKDIGFSVINDKDNAPISGKLIRSSSHMKGSSGDTVLFQYNAYMDSQWIFKGLFIDPELIYLVGRYTENRWVLVRRTGDGMGEVMFTPRQSYISKGDTVLYIPEKSHQLELPLFNTLDTSKDKSLVAVKYRDILMYDKK